MRASAVIARLSIPSSRFQHSIASKRRYPIDHLFAISEIHPFRNKNYIRLRDSGEKVTGTFCAKHPSGLLGKRCLSPFSRNHARLFSRVAGEVQEMELHAVVNSARACSTASAWGLSRGSRPKRTR